MLGTYTVQKLLANYVLGTLLVVVFFDFLSKEKVLLYVVNTPQKSSTVPLLLGYGPNFFPPSKSHGTRPYDRRNIQVCVWSSPKKVMSWG